MSLSPIQLALLDGQGRCLSASPGHVCQHAGRKAAAQARDASKIQELKAAAAAAEQADAAAAKAASDAEAEKAKADAALAALEAEARLLDPEGPAFALKAEEVLAARATATEKNSAALQAAARLKALRQGKAQALAAKSAIEDNHERLDNSEALSSDPVKTIAKHASQFAEKRAGDEAEALVKAKVEAYVAANPSALIVPVMLEGVPTIVDHAADDTVVARVLITVE